MMKNQFSSFSVVMLFLVLFVSTMSLISLSMAGRPYEQESSSSSSRPTKAYIVYIRGDNSESHYLSVLSNVLGSREAAQESLLYTYHDAVTGFVARLTSKQASEMKRERDVLQVVDDKNVRGVAPGDK